MGLGYYGLCHSDYILRNGLILILRWVTIITQLTKGEHGELFNRGMNSCVQGIALATSKSEPISR
jgi:hypothetical protein